MLEMHLLLIPALLVALIIIGNWRYGVALAIPIGLLQDPVRKLIPGEPVFLVAIVVVYVGLAAVVAISRLGGLRLRLVFGNQPMLIRFVNLFVIIVLIQSLLSALRFGSPILSVIGLIAYLSPLPALWLAFYYPRNSGDIERLLIRYIVLVIVIACTIQMSVLGLDWTIFEQVGEGLHIYDRFQRIRIEAHTGLLRGPDLAAWHMGAASCFLILLAVVTQRRWILTVGGPIVLFLIGSGLFTGRRKLLVAVLAYLVIYGLLLYYFRQRTGRRAIFAALSMAFLSVVVAAFVSPDRLVIALSPYLIRGQSVFGDIGDRFYTMVFEASTWAIHRGGFFGLGAGTGSQGSQHFTGYLAGGAAEGGFAKILVELGVPGLLVALLAFGSLFLYLWRILHYCQTRDAEMTRLALGLFAFLMTQLPLFLGASQTYGDPLVLLILGLCLGFLLAIPRLLHLRMAMRQATVAPVVPQFRDLWALPQGGS